VLVPEITCVEVESRHSLIRSNGSLNDLIFI
jgi:hypothetical protein